MAISTTYFASLWPGAALEFQMGYQGRRRSWEGAYFAAPCGSASAVEPFSGYLKALGLNNDLCSSDDYTGSMAVSAEVHDQLPHVDGIIYVSRQMNTGRAIVLFERSGLQRSSAVTPLKNHATIGALLTKLNVAMFRRGKPTGTPH